MGGNPTERALSASRLAEMGFCERWVVLEQPARMPGRQAAADPATVGGEGAAHADTVEAPEEPREQCSREQFNHTCAYGEVETPCKILR